MNVEKATIAARENAEATWNRLESMLPHLAKSFDKSVYESDIEIAFLRGVVFSEQSFVEEMKAAGMQP